MKVLRFEHAGVCCAIPPSQIVRGADAPDGPPLSLFGAEEREPETWLFFECAEATGWIPVRSLSLDDLEQKGVLSPVASRVVRHPHVVGWTEQHGRWVWLVDLERYRPGPVPR